jgi:hypothetical protein
MYTELTKVGVLIAVTAVAALAVVTICACCPQQAIASAGADACTTTCSNISLTLTRVLTSFVHTTNYTTINNNEPQLWESNTAQARECQRCSAKLNKKGELVLKKWLITMQKISVDPALAPNVILASAEEETA